MALMLFAGCGKGAFKFTSSDERREKSVLNGFGLTCNPGQTPSAEPLTRLSKTEYINTIRDLLTYQYISGATTTTETTRRAGLAQAAFDAITNDFSSIQDPSRTLQYQRFEQSLGGTDVLSFTRVAGKIGIRIADPNNETASLTEFFGSCASSLTGSVRRTNSSSPWTLNETNSAQTNCLTTFINNFGLLAYRRPIQAAERTALLKLYVDAVAETTNSAASATSATTGLPRAGLAILVMKLLASPQFLFHLYTPEQNPEQTGRYRFGLNSYDLLSKLSYQFWESTPDATLLQMAPQLQTAEGYTQALDYITNSAIGKEKMRPVVRRFFAEFMRASKLPDAEANTSAIFRDFTQEFSTQELADLGWQAADEIMDLGAHYTLDDAEGNFDNLMTSDRSFAKGAGLSKVYGVSPWNGQGAGVPFPPQQKRGGLLNRVAFLMNINSEKVPDEPVSVYNHLIMRGVHIRRSILCDELGAPPANVEPPEPMYLPPNPTTREHMSEATKSATCAACHSKINHLAFPLEAFDSLGRHRGGVEKVYDVLNPTQVTFVSRSVDLNATPAATFTDKRQANNPQELNQLLLDSGKPQACFARAYYSFTTRQLANGREDGCEIDSLRKILAGKGRLIDFFSGVARSPAFKEREVPK